jgi:rhodanese-related sulfurtransferase
VWVRGDGVPVSELIAAASRAIPRPQQVTEWGFSCPPLADEDAAHGPSSLRGRGAALRPGSGPRVAHSDDPGHDRQNSPGGQMTKSAAELVAEAKAQIENLDPDAVEAELASGDVVLVDIRDAEELAEAGRIPGSVHVPRGMLEFRADPSTPYHQPPLDPSARVILHCAGGGRSALAAVTLKEMGYENVAHLDGGFNAWKEAGKPVA